jgi:hypothetical protein
MSRQHDSTVPGRTITMATLANFVLVPSSAFGIDDDARAAAPYLSFTEYAIPHPAKRDSCKEKLLASEN